MRHGLKIKIDTSTSLHQSLRCLPTASSSGPVHRCWIIQVGVPSFDHFNSSLSWWRVSPAYFVATMMSVWSLSIFDRLVVSVKVLLSFNKQVVTWPLKTCIEVLAVKDLVRTMSELCQSDRQWALYMFLPINPTFETSPLGMFTDRSRAVVDL